METAALKSFATWARTALIREVSARMAVVLAPASLARIEQPRAVEALEKAVAQAGDGSAGGKAVVDRVAYTWFNRILALRFMDANGYTRVGIVSPTAGSPGGQPEILAEAKRGNVDASVVSPDTGKAIIALLNGTRRSEDPQGEAYALLLTEYCRHWHRAMPFMFEREGDFTELLIPANLLADDSLPSRAAQVLTTQACADVEVIGWLYQFYISERKDEVFAGFKKNKKAGPAEIPAATQLFTPNWIVRYLVENSLGRLWMLNRPASGLVEQMKYYIPPVDEEKDFLKISSPEEIRLIDPACGSGHMLTYAFDLLYAMYEEEGYSPSEIPRLILINNLFATEIDPRAAALAAFALTMKARAKLRTFFNKSVAPNVCVIEPIRFTPDELTILSTRDGNRDAQAAFWTAFEASDSLGSLIRPGGALSDPLGDHLAALAASSEQGLLLDQLVDRAQGVLRQTRFLTRKHHVVVTNPPYMGSKNMDVALATFAKSEYPDAKADLMTMFMRRAFELTVPNGYWGIIDLPSWMFLTTFAAFRQWLLSGSWLQSVVHMGRGVFGSDFGSVALVCRRTSADVGRTGLYRRLFEEHVEVRPNEQIRRLFLEAAYNRFEVSQATFKSLPGEPIAYWLSEDVRAAFSKGRRVSEYADPRQGLATADNNQFLRLWWEVSASRTAFLCADRDEAVKSGARWFPYNKGGEFRRWWGNQQHLVNWEDDGQKIKAFGTENGGRPRSAVRNPHTHFQPSVSWSDVTSGAPAFRSYPPGFLHDVTGMSVFGDDSQRARLISFLNSSVATALLKVVAPTMHAQIGDISLLPIEDYETPLAVLEALVAVARNDWDDLETSWDFAAPSWLRGLDTTGLAGQVLLADRIRAWSARWAQNSRDQKAREAENNRIVAEGYGLGAEVTTDVALHRVALTRNVKFRFGPEKSPEEYATLERSDVALELVSYAVGCMFGRYSLDTPGLILADQGATIEDYLERLPTDLSFAPDPDNVIPVVDGDWFEDDITARFRAFLRTAFGERHFEENLSFVTESLGVRDIRDYFVKSFYRDHVQRYKKRPIYWLFSSSKGSFNALIYLHRYTPSTASTVLNEYLREFTAKLRSSLQHQELLAAGDGTPRQQAAAQKEADRLRKVLVELEEYEHDVLYPLASRQVVIDLDDGVKANYPKFGAALKKIPGLEAGDE